MNFEEKCHFVDIYMDIKVPFNDKEWLKLLNDYNIGNNDVISNKNTKYQFVDENGSTCSVVYTISNGNAFDCPALLSGRCNVPCYGLKGTFSWNSTKVNKEFQRIIWNFAPLEWLFQVIKHHATSKRKNPNNLLRFLRINEVSDFTVSFLSRMVELSKMLWNDDATKHIRMFSYSKMDLDWQTVGKLPNLTINCSQAINPLYLNGNVFIAVNEDTYNSIIENDIVRKCNCDTNCHNCELCYKNNGLIIYCLIH